MQNRKINLKNKKKKLKKRLKHICFYFVQSQYYTYIYYTQLIVIKLECKHNRTSIVCTIQMKKKTVNLEKKNTNFINSQNIYILIL